MAYEKITIISDEKGIYNVKSVIEAFENFMHSVEISRPKYGKLSDFILVSFKVPMTSFPIVIEKLMLNDIRVLETRNNKNLVDTIKQKIYEQKKGEIKGKGWDDINLKKKENINVGDIEELAEQGKFDEVLKISKNMIKYGTAIVEKAKIVLADTAVAAIDNAREEAFEDEKKAKQSLKILLEIAADSTLKAMQKMDLVKQAGLTAVDICALYFDFIKELINISNHNKIHNYVNVKSAAKFSEIVFEDEEKYHDQLTMAIRNLNINWLTIAFDVVRDDLKEEEISQFKRITNFVKETRTL